MRFIYLASGVVCLHPVFIWMFKRAVDGSDEPWGILSLGGALFMVFRSMRHKNSTEIPRLSVPAFLFGIYAVSLWWLSPLPRAILGMSALASLCMCLFEKNRFNLGLLLLFWLSLPLMASLQFYAGYPLRIFVAELACHLLRISGHPVTRIGVNLELNSHTVSVDAACSGLKMLWTGGVATALLISHYALPKGRAFFALVSAACILIFANILRATALFQWEIQKQHWLHIPFADLVHTAVGLVLFAIAVIAIQKSTHFFQRSNSCQSASRFS